MLSVEISQLIKSFRIHEKEPGLRGSVKSLFSRKWMDKMALDQISLNISSGEIVGLLGSNGAGKTTLMKVLTGIIKADAGTARVLGFDPWKKDPNYLKKISLIMGQKSQLWWDLPAGNCFILLKEIYQIPPLEFKRRLNYLSDCLNVTHVLKTQIRRLSLGERMKVELVASLLHSPKVIFLDEPTIGLDHASQVALRGFLMQYHAENKPTIILTSHYIEDVNALCQRFVIVRNGGIVYDGQREDLNSRFLQNKTIKVRIDSTSGFTKDVETRARDVLESSMSQKARVVQFSASDQTLEVSVSRAAVSEAVTQLLGMFQVLDLNIEEEDIGELISSIQSSGLGADKS